MTMGKKIQKWSHTGSLGQLDQLDSDIKAYATTLPDAWFKLYRKYDEMIAGLETHAEAIQLEVENIEDKLDDLVMGPGMLEEMTAGLVRGEVARLGFCRVFTDWARRQKEKGRKRKKRRTPIDVEITNYPFVPNI